MTELHGLALPLNSALQRQLDSKRIGLERRSSGKQTIHLTNFQENNASDEFKKNVILNYLSQQQRIDAHRRHAEKRIAVSEWTHLRHAHRRKTIEA